MGATKIGVIGEGPIDHVLLEALLVRISEVRARFSWPLEIGDVAESLRIRKRGHGGVFETVKRLVRVLQSPPWPAEYSFFVVVLDARPAWVVGKVRRLVQGKPNFVFGTAIHEIEAWWLGDRRSTLQWLELAASAVSRARYGAPRYRAEKDRTPKKTLDELTMLSPSLEMRYGSGNLGLAEEFARTWRSNAHIGDIESQCPKGFGKFSKHATDALKRAKSGSGRLF